MKNIHVQSTDKETILHYDHTGLFLSLNYQLSNTINSIVQGRNIYITSDTADIYDNDYIITKDGRLVQVSFLLSSDLDGASKVILTTDTDLLKDNIQKINSKFLVWFVKNPNCEYVQVEINYKKFKKGNITLSNCYELIIPNENINFDKIRELCDYCGNQHDLTGHGAIRYYYDNFKGGIDKECEDFSSPDNFPSEIVQDIKLGKFSE